jgi:hypothetical protein
LHVLADVTRSGRAKIAASIAAGAVLSWAAWDLYAPRSHSLRDFRPDEVGRLETAMWKSYYAHERLSLFGELATLLRRQYDLPALRSYFVAYHAARAAVAFQRGQQHSDCDKALPDVAKFYGAIRQVSSEPFDIQRAARLELDWWIVHRERASHPREDLDRTLAELQGELYHLPASQVMGHAKLRAEAMLIRDRAAENGTPTEQQWAEIEQLLRSSWRSLWEAVNARRGA